MVNRVVTCEFTDLKAVKYKTIIHSDLHNAGHRILYGNS